MFRTLIVGPFAILIGLASAIAIGLLGGALVGLCILILPLAWLYDAIVGLLPRRHSRRL